MYLCDGQISHLATGDNCKKLQLIFPPHDDSYQYVTTTGATLDSAALTLTLAIVDVRTFARVDEPGLVQELAQTPQDGWIPVPTALNRHISLGWHYDDDFETFFPPNVADYLDSQRTGALQQIADRHAAIIATLTGNATAAERDTWIVKEQAARDVIAGGTGGGVIVPVEGETALQLARKVVAKAEGFRSLVGLADNFKRRSEKAVESLALQTLDDLALLSNVLADASTNANAFFTE